MPIVVQCNSCKKKIKAPDKFAGKRVKCPGCQAVLSIPGGAPAATSPAASQAKPAPKPAAKPAPAAQSFAASSLLDDEIPLQQPTAPAQPVGNSLADMLDDDIPIRQETAAQAAVDVPSNCPGCGDPVTPGVVLCVNCGYDFRAQAKRTQQIGEGGASGGKKKKKKREMFGGHSAQVMQLLRGCLFSFIGACVGAFIWYIVARFTFTEWAIISWGLGGLAGIGMATGYGHEEMLGGLCAAVIAFLGIVLAKLTIFFWILGPFLIALGGLGEGDFDEAEFSDEEFVAGEEFPGEVQDDVSDEGGVSEGEAAESDISEEDAADGMVADEEYADEEWADDEFDEEFGAGGVAVLGAGLFFMTMFGIYDILFVILACATAFKIGSSGSGGG